MLQEIFKAGVVPMVLTFGGWFYVAVLVLAMLYYFVLFFIRLILRRNRFQQ